MSTSDRSASGAGGSPFPERAFRHSTTVPGAPTTRWISGAVPLLLGFLPLVLLGSTQGGYFPSAWGWATLGLLWPPGIALVLRSRLRISRAECAFFFAWLAVGGWIALSLIWSQDLPETVLEVER